ncbi:VOC family protein [Alishewanella sp. SMS8]|uniref:VOC family protein n=1 Tax=Alishewanella sp. SMS8 TaxID=2994676 RepID=UPI0027423BFD|nr:VOC family protein [Alishewanella sp. SMS8]MDP5206244.1 VOC family protein [Alishewanella sp. SMS9]MDP5459249.1 VOC family protein [Alishewanella sp. SMS8]
MAHKFISCISLLVTDYDAAIQFYTQCLGFNLIEDTMLSADKRWVKVGPPGAQTAILLAKASNAQQLALVGCQTADRVGLFLQTDNFWQDYEKMCQQGVVFLEAPREETYATVVVFQDLYGNKWDLLQPKQPD